MVLISLLSLIAPDHVRTVRFERLTDGQAQYNAYRRSLADLRRKRQLEELEASGDIVAW